MPKKVVLLFSLLVVAASFLSYKLGSVPVALAKGRPTPQENSAAEISPPLPGSPGTWVLTSSPAEGVGASVTRAAGGAGVQHVATCVSATAENYDGAAYPLPLQLKDGATVLMQWYLVDSVGSPGSVVFSVCGLNVVGSLNTSMTLQFNIANPPNQYTNVSLVGYDAT